MVNADNLRDANPWHPMNNPVDLKTIGKLLEELGEAVSAAARCMIQGIDEAEPVTGKINRKWLEDEFADLEANMKLTKDRFNLIVDQTRVEKKLYHLSQWHNLA